MTHLQPDSNSIRPEVISFLPWYAIHTRSNQERLVSICLENKGFEWLLPVYRVQKRWSDRIMTVTLPLFPGYIFCRFDTKRRMPILSSPGVVAIVGFGSEPAPIPDYEIKAVQEVLDSGLAPEPHEFLYEGQRVRINRGPLEGMEGILLKKKNQLRLVISVSLLQRSISVEVDREWVSAVPA
jgi:transcription elongation factor/antiterminator RfaH